MKVLFINSVVDYGSTGKIVRDLSEELLKMGHETKIIFGRQTCKDESETFSIVDKIGSANHLIMTRLFGRHGLHSKQATKNAISEIEAFGPDVINIHNIHGYYMNFPMLFDYLKEKDISVYWTLHDAWSFSGSSAYFDYNGCEEWDNGCVVCNSTSDYPKATGYINQKKIFELKKEKFTSIKDMTIITPSNWLTELTRGTFLQKYPVKTIYNGIDLETFKFVDATHVISKYKLEEKFIILGLASKWENRKGLNYFVELASMMGKDEVIILVGLDKQQISKMPENIIGIERTQNMEELVELYNAADVFMNPTLEDNFPTTNIESLACGTPVITFNTGGSPEAVDEKTGIVTKEKDVESLFEAKESIKNSKIDFRVNCRERAENKYSKELFTTEYLNLFFAEQK